MRRPRSLLIALLLALAPMPVLAQTANDRAGQSADEPPDTIVRWKKDEPEMRTAIAEAQRTLPEWLAVLDDPPPGVTRIVFKYPLEGYEHIWVGNVTREGDVLHGVLTNTPEAKGHRIGERVSVPLDRVSDWGYRDADGVAHGYVTVRVLLKQVSPEEAASVRESLGWKE